MARQFFVPPEAISGDRIALPAEVAHHLRSVLRMNPGDELLLLDGIGGHYRCRLLELDRKGGLAAIEQRWQQADSALPVRLLQAVPKGDRFDLVLQKGTELGIAAFSPVWTQRSVPSADADRGSKRLLRWRRIVAEAARQSRRPLLPECDEPQPLAAALQATTEALRLMLWEEGSVPLVDALPSTPPPDVALLVGPEGGFTAEEAQSARDAGYVPVHLGQRILRSETAGFAVSAILQYVYGDLGAR